jgi:transcription elongation GreA/GreB family factor
LKDTAKAKQGLIAALTAKVEEELANMRRAAKDAREAATHEEAKPENDKDTRALEASYLAGAQAARVRELEGALKLIGQMAVLDLQEKAIQASAIVVLEDEDEKKTTFFVAPFGGGATIAAEGVSAQVVTPQSPLGRALLGRTAGDTIELRGSDLTIVDVR